MVSKFTNSLNLEVGLLFVIYDEDSKLNCCEFVSRMTF